LLRRRRLLGSTTHITAKQTNQGSPNQTATAQKYTPLFGAVYRTALGFAVTFAAPASAMRWKLFCNRHYSDTWQPVINTGTTIVTFLIVFLIQNMQNRDARGS